MANNEQADLPKIKLYWLESSRAQNVLWLLEELHLPYILELFHRDPNTRLAPPELKKVHALGKSPIITILPASAPPDAKPVVLAETGFIMQYLCEHFATPESGLMPARYPTSADADTGPGNAGLETEAWTRWQYLLHYAEGSLMPILFMSMILNTLKSPKVPFFIRPVTSLVANQLFAAVVFPGAQNQLEFLESLLARAPSGGEGQFICGGDKPTAADIALSFGLLAARDRFVDFGSWEKNPKLLFPKVWAWIAMMEGSEGYQRSCAKVREIDDRFKIKFEQ